MGTEFHVSLVHGFDWVNNTPLSVTSMFSVHGCITVVVCSFSLCNYLDSHIFAFTHLEPKWPPLFKVNAQKQGLFQIFSNQNKGHLKSGSFTYIYIYCIYTVYIYLYTYILHIYVYIFIYTDSFTSHAGRLLTLEDDGGRCRATGDDEVMQVSSGWFIATSHNRFGPRKGSFLERNYRKFQENLGWWKHITWPDEWWICSLNVGIYIYIYTHGF